MAWIIKLHYSRLKNSIPISQGGQIRFKSLNLGPHESVKQVTNSNFSMYTTTWRREGKTEKQCERDENETYFNGGNAETTSLEKNTYATSGDTLAEATHHPSCYHYIFHLSSFLSFFRERERGGKERERGVLRIELRFWFCEGLRVVK